MKIPKVFLRWITIFNVILFGFIYSTSVVLAASSYDSGRGTVTQSGYNLSYSWETTYEKADSGQSGDNNGGSGGVSLSGTVFTLTAKSSYYKPENKNIFSGSFNYTQDIVYNYTTRLTLANEGNSGCIVNYTTKGAMGEFTGSVTLEAGSTKIFTLATTTAATSQSAQNLSGSVTIDSIEICEEATVEFASWLHGDYSFSIGEKEAVSMLAGTGTVSEKIVANTEVVLSAGDAEEGYAFYGWMIGDKIVSTASSYVYIPTTDIKIYPIFLMNSSIEDAEPFMVGSNTYMFWHLAMQDASLTGNTVILTQDYSMPTTLAENGLLANNDYVSSVDGNMTYIVPSGVKLLIPFNNGNTANFNASPNIVAASTISPYCTLTVQEKTTIQCHGSINVNGQVLSSASSFTGIPTGSYGRIYLNSETAKLVIAGATTNNPSAGTLYCYGFIIGTGVVEAQSGAIVYETFEATGFRGGSTAAQWISSSGLEKTYKSFLFSEYGVHNIETTFRLYAGAEEYAVFSCEPSIGSPIQSSIKMLGSSGSLFELYSGAYVERTYDYTSDHTTYTIYGQAALSHFELKLATMLGSQELDTASYILGLNGGMRVVCATGSDVSINYNLKLMPGFIITVDEGATLTVNSNLYIYDAVDYVDHYYVYYTQLSKNESIANPGIHKNDCMPTQYIATTHKTYDNTSTAEESYPRTITADDHAQVIVKGTLEVGTSGGIYTTTDEGTSAGKVIKGSGTFINNNTTAKADVTDVLDELVWEYYSSSDLTLKDDNIKCSPAIGLLAGISTSANDANDSFGADTYYGLGDSYNNYWYKASKEVEPTCTEDGYTKYYCDDESKYIAIPTNKKATGHSYGNWEITTPPTSKTEGVETRTCGACGESETRTIIAIYGTSVRVGDSLDLYFYVRSDMLEGTAYYAQITRSYADNASTEDTIDPYTEALEPIPFAEWEPYGEYYRFCYSGIAGKEMTDQVSVTIYHEDGTYASTTATETIADYALRTLKSSTATEELKAVLMDMVRYGANCQTYFNYNTENLAGSKEDFDSYSSYGGRTLQQWDKNDNSGNFSASVVAENRLVYSFYLSDVTSNTVTVSYVNHYNQSKSFDITPVYNETKKLYCVDVPELAVADGHQKITCTYTDSTGIQTVTGSIEGYLAKIDGTEEDSIVFETLMYFVDSAYAYFH